MLKSLAGGAGEGPAWCSVVTCQPYPCFRLTLPTPAFPFLPSHTSLQPFAGNCAAPSQSVEHCTLWSQRCFTSYRQHSCARTCRFITIIPGLQAYSAACTRTCTLSACTPHRALASCCSLRQSCRSPHNPGSHCRRNRNTSAKHSGTKQNCTFMCVKGVGCRYRKPMYTVVYFFV